MSGAGIRLAYNDWVSFEDERHRVIGLSGPVVRLLSESGKTQMIGLLELATDPSFAAAAPPPGLQEEVEEAAALLEPGAVLDQLPKLEKQRVLELEAHLLEVTTGYQRGSFSHALEGEPRPAYDPSLTLRQRVDAKAAELGITPRWLWKRLDTWREEGLWGLVDKRKTRLHNPLGRTDPRIVQAIADQYEAERFESSATVGGRFRRRVQNRLNHEHGQDAVELPPSRAFYRLVELVLDRPPSGPATTRQSEANSPDHEYRHVDATRPGEVVLMDTTPLDAYAYDVTIDDYVKVELTVALDVAPRSVLAWILTPEGTKGIDLGLLLADVLVPEPMRPSWPDSLRFAMLPAPADRLVTFDQRLADAAALPVVYPETILIDHGKPFQSQVMERACRKLRINVQDARVMTPTDKAKVERVFGTIRTQFAENIASYKGHDVAHRGKDVEHRARWTIAELTEFFAEYIVSVYQRQRHKGLIAPGHPAERLSPNEAYALALSATGYVTCPTDPALYYELLPIEWRQIRPEGVQIDDLFYWDDVLFPLRRHRSPYSGGKWPIRRDPRNILHAYFHHPETSTWHLLRWDRAPDSMRPCTDTTLAEVKTLLAARGQNPHDQDQIAAALTDLQNRMDAPETWTRTDRRHFARDNERARAQARDRNQAAPAIETTGPPDLRVIDGGQNTPDPDDNGRPAPAIDLSDLEGCEVWDPDNPAGMEL